MNLLDVLKSVLFKKEPGRKEMVRYSRRKDGHKKNTLYTQRKDGKIFYGISRLNKTDVFDREYGLNLAKSRVKDALDAYKQYNDFKPECYNGCGLYTKFANQQTLKNSYFGWVHPRDVKQLLEHFRNMGK